MPAAPQSQVDPPLCVDLDGTLIRTDLLWESWVRLLGQNPLYFFATLLWLLKGRAFLKQQIAARAEPDAATLPYCQPLLDFLRAERRRGRAVILATAADRRSAQRIADHLGLFTDVIASDGKTNLRGKHKVAELTRRFGERGFDYAGNSAPDLDVWQHARSAIVVNASSSLTAKAQARAHVSQTFPPAGPILQSLLRIVRPHQWIKNLIIFVPLITSHQVTNPHMLRASLLAFIALSLCASGVYIINDLLDVESDRHHPRKRTRPFASGQLPLPMGIALAPILLFAAVVTGLAVSGGFLLVLAVYFALTTGYSLRFKGIVLVDVFVLAGLYTLRLIAGHAATGIAYSMWLLAFSMFIFLSLALVKRFQELFALRQQNQVNARGRGYTVEDLELVATLGSVSGYLSALILALYVNSDEVRLLYQHPTVLLLICPLLLYWVSRVWLLAHRGQMPDDPVVFALKDRVSYVIGLLTLGVLFAATGF